jgi:hypothetical protein
MNRREFIRSALLLSAAVGAPRGLGAKVAERGLEADLTSVPLAARSGPRASTLFTTLPSEQTGLKGKNAYDDPAMWGQFYDEFISGSIGTGVAIGDYDGDGRPDIFMASKTGPNRLFRNLGGFRFEDVTAHAGVAGPTDAWKQGAAFADVNNDGLLDIYVCRFNAPNLLYINQGDGTFKEMAHAYGLDVTDACVMAAFCDYDRDGRLDVYITTNLLNKSQHPDGQRGYLFHNNGDGTFSNVTDRAGISGELQSHSATWWDYDEDGWPDLYVAADFWKPDQLYHNNRDGTFTDVISSVVPHMPHFSMGADFGDLNNDGHLDLIVADMAARTRYKDHRGMAKLRANLPDDQQFPRAAPQYMQNALYINTGTGRMLEAAHLAGLHATDWTFSVRLEDLDLDGRLDAYFTNGMVREFTNADLVLRSFSVESKAESIRVMKMSPPLAERHLAFRNLGDLRFEDVSAAWGLDHVGVGFGAAFGDLDGDGDLDLVFASFEGELTVCRNDIDTGHAVVLELRGTASNRFGVGATVRIVTADGTQMRTLALARGYSSTSEPVVHFGLGENTVIQRLTVEWPSGRLQTFSNLAADRRYTITEPAGAPQAPPPARPAALFVEAGRVAHLDVRNHEVPFDELSQQRLLPFRFNRPGPSAVFADLDGDGEDDLALGGVSGESGHLLSNLGDGLFLLYGANVFRESMNLADGPILAFDADADGRMDLLVTKAGTAAPADSPAYQPRLLLNDGRGRFAVAPPGMIPALPISVGAVAAADFDRSGRLGIFIGGRIVPGRYPHAPRSALLAWREGRYVNVISELAPSLETRGMVTAALWCDVDGDGWPDLLVAYDWGPVACYRNVEGKRFDDVTEKLGFASAGSGWWRSLAVGDFNGDGRPDIIVGNIGLNTRYRASAADPAVLYADVVLNGSAPQLVEAQAEGGRWYPLRTRETLASVFPSLGHRFPTAESYAGATLEEVFPAEVLASATKFAATELRSGVFLSQRDGTYRFVPLPRLAQIAPVHGVAAGDFDGDGRTDIVLVGNSYAPIPETGRFDGGLGWMLDGDGAGGFTPVPAGESGIVVPGDARALAVADLNQDGWPDVLVTRSDDVPLAFINGGLRGRNSFGVALRGAPGNPTAVGSRLTLLLRDGSTQTAEISAGAGYLSQSSATAFFGYPDSAPPVRLGIRWPDGRETEHSFAAPPPKLLRLSQA